MSASTTEVDDAKTVTTTVRRVTLRLAAHTRALELCARMNRELEVLDFIDGLRPGEVLYDLGACEGRFAVYAAQRGVRCYAFEPEMNYQTLLQNIELNGEKARENLIALKYAVGAAHHRTTLKIGQLWAGGHHRIVADAPGRSDLQITKQAEEEIDVVALDRFVKENVLPAPHGLKVDIDGSEQPFLDGAGQTLLTPQLRALIFELNPTEPSYAEITRRLETAGFSLTARHEIEPNLFNTVFTRSVVP